MRFYSTQYCDVGSESADVQAYLDRFDTCHGIVRMTGREYGFEPTVCGFAKRLLVILTIFEDINGTVKCARKWSCELDELFVTSPVNAPFSISSFYW